MAGRMMDKVALRCKPMASRRLILEVPGQLSVVGFDDVPMAASLRPPLTTVRQPLLEKGRLAALRLIEGAELGTDLLPTELVVRGSTGPVPGG